MDVVDIVSEEARVTIIVTAVSIGDSKKLVDYNRINYLLDYDKTTDIEIINIH